MSTEQINQAPIEDAEMKELLQSEVKFEEDDNKLVTREDLVDSPKKSLWTATIIISYIVDFQFAFLYSLHLRQSHPLPY